MIKNIFEKQSSIYKYQKYQNIWLFVVLLAFSFFVSSKFLVFHLFISFFFFFFLSCPSLLSLLIAFDALFDFSFFVSS